MVSIRARAGSPVRASERLSDQERTLWGLVIVATVADGLLTYYGLRIGMTEANPVMAGAVASFGYGGIALVKAAALAAAVAVRLSLPDRHGPTVAAALTIPWGLAAAINAVGIVGL